MEVIPTRSAVLHALRKAKKTHKKLYRLTGYSEGVCNCLPYGQAGDWIRWQIHALLGSHAYVTGWLYSNNEGKALIREHGGITEEFSHTYRNAWIDHMIQFYSTHLKD